MPLFVSPVVKRAANVCNNTKMDSNRLMIITDLHAGPVAGTKIGPHAVSLLDTILNHSNSYQPDLIVDLGDRITSTSKRRDEENTRRIARVFANTPVPREHLPGNHDVKRMTLEESSAYLGSPLASRTRQFGRYNFVFWAPDLPSSNRVYASADLDWLQGAISEPNSVLFTHFPFLATAVADQDMPRSPYRIDAEADNAIAALDIVREAGTVRAVISGHVHGNSLNYASGIPFVTLQSVTEAISGTNRPAGAWALIDVSDTFRLEVFGLDPVKLEF